MMKKPKKSSITAFIALPDSAKERIFRELDVEKPEQSLKRSRPLTAGERQQWRRFKRRIGRPRVGRGVKTISLTVERGLLEQADAFAKKHGLSRAKVVAMGLKRILGTAA